jgi:hypothetical protein
LNFVLVDFVSDKYFVPYLAWSAFLLAAVAAWLEQRLGSRAVIALGVVVACVLLGQFSHVVGREHGRWRERAQEIVRDHPNVASFSPMLFAATGAEPGCGLDNPALAYGSYGDAFLVTEQTEKLRFTDERLVECLKANRDMPMLVDWSFYFFTRPGSPLRAYLEDDGKAQRLFSSREARAQWNRPLLTMPPE